MIQKIYSYLNKPYAVVVIMLLAPFFGFIDRNISFFFGLAVVLLLLIGSKYDWSSFGLGSKLTVRTVVKSLGITLVLFLAFQACKSST